MKTFPDKVATGIAEPVTKPTYLMRYGTLRLSSREKVVKASQVYSPAGIDYTDGQIRIFNESGAYTDFFRGVRAYMSVWFSYGDPPFTDADWYFDFWGETGAIAFEDWITVQLRDTGSRAEPHYVVARPTFNHLLRKGTKILTPTGTYVLEGPP